MPTHNRKPDNDERPRNAAPIGSRIPPQNLDAEISMLGSLLLDNEAVMKVIDIVTPEDFYRPEHAMIYAAMGVLFEKRTPIDLITVADELKRIKKLEEAGGPAKLSTLVSSVATAANVTHYANIVREKAMLRRLIHVAADIGELGFQEELDTTTVIDTAESALFRVTQRFLKQNFVSVRSILDDSFERLGLLANQEGFLRGIPTGFRGLDRILGGLQKSDLLILAARPSMGKCVTGDTRILDPETGEMRTIQSMVESNSGRVATLGKEWAFGSENPSAYIYNGVKPTFKLRTALGREIEATATHPLLTVTGWKSLGTLVIGDRIAVPRKLPFFGTFEMPAHEVSALAYFITDGNVTQTQPRFTNVNPIIVADFLKSMRAFPGIKVRHTTSGGMRASTFALSVDLTAWQHAKNSWAQRFAEFSTRYQLEVRTALSQVGLSPENVGHWQKGTSQPSRATALKLGGLLSQFPMPESYPRENPVTDFLKAHAVWGKGAATKVVPAAVFQLPQEKQALFLNRLFACDGIACFSRCGGRDVPVVSYGTISRQLAYDVQHLLLRFGIIAKVRARKASYEVEIHQSEDIIRFSEKIGIIGKEKALARAVEVAESNKGNGWTKDTIPQEVWDRILKLKGAQSWRSIYVDLGMPLTHNIHAGKRALSRRTVQRLAEYFGDTELAQISQADVFWDRIVSIESTGEKPVYDLTVPEHHNFVANDIVVHNTAFALGIAEHIAVEEKKVVGLFSLEMSKEQLVDRLVSSLGRVDSWKLRNGNLSEDDMSRLIEAQAQLAEANLYIDDAPMATVMEVRAKARRLQAEHGLDLLIIDYLQLMQGTARSRAAENRTQEVSEISRSLKGLAKELDCPVIALSQLSRAVESRNDKRPMLSDLRESGCITGDTLITRADTGERIQIKDLVGQKDIPVWALNEDYKLERFSISKVFSSGYKQVFELKFRSGRRIKASANHKFRTYTEWMRLDELKAGQKLALPRAYQPQLADNQAYTDAHLIFFAHMVGDGCYVPKQPLHYTSADSRNILTVQLAARKLFNIPGRVIPQNNWFHLYLPSPVRAARNRRHPFYTWLFENGLDLARSYEKRLPESLFSCSSRQLRLFLRHLWATDGCVHLSKKEACTLYYATTSTKLASDVQHLLLRLGIQSTLRQVAQIKKGKTFRPSFHVEIQGSVNQLTFLKEIGCQGIRGDIIPRCIQILEAKVPNPNTDTIDASIWQTVINPARETAQKSWRAVQSEMGMAYSGSSLFKAGVSRERLARVAEIVQSTGLSLLAKSDVYWDEIVSITPLLVEEVFDATVPGPHNFVANDIIIHNSIEQDADVVMFLYRDDYYNKNKEEHDNIVEVIVSKHRNGPTGDAKLSAQFQYSRFFEIDLKHQ